MGFWGVPTYNKTKKLFFRLYFMYFMYFGAYGIYSISRTSSQQKERFDKVP